MDAITQKALYPTWWHRLAYARPRIPLVRMIARWWLRPSKQVWQQALPVALENVFPRFADMMKPLPDDAPDQAASLRLQQTLRDALAVLTLHWAMLRPDALSAFLGYSVTAEALTVLKGSVYGFPNRVKEAYGQRRKLILYQVEEAGGRLKFAYQQYEHDIFKDT